MLREAQILQALRSGEVRLPPLVLSLVDAPPEPVTGGRWERPDARVDIGWGAGRYRFSVEILTQATPKAFRSAVQQVRACATATGLHPLLVTPYLSPQRIAELEAKGVSGLDLCGNGFVVVPGEVLVLREGNPNRYPAGRKIRNVYRGASSLVARVFLLRPRYESVRAVLDEILDRDGRVSLGTVSKVLRTLDEDLVIRRDGRASELLQAEVLLDRLGESHRPPRVDARRRYRWRGGEGGLLPALGEGARGIVWTGAASVGAYGVMPREKSVQCYCTAIGPIERDLGAALEETDRFPDLELLETSDPTAYFDRRRTDGVPVASPLQCWLELRAGDKRQQNASVAVRTRMLSELRDAGWSPT